MGEPVLVEDQSGCRILDELQRTNGTYRRTVGGHSSLEAGLGWTKPGGPFGGGTGVVHQESAAYIDIHTVYLYSPY